MADKYEKIKVRTKSGLLVTKFKDKRTGKIYNQRPVFDPTKSKVSSRLNLGISEELKALQAAERLRLSELPPRSLPTNFTGGALPNRQSLQSLPSTQDLIDVQRESDLAQAFNKAKNRDRTVKQSTQFPNLRPQDTLRTPISQDTAEKALNKEGVGQSEGLTELKSNDKTSSNGIVKEPVKVEPNKGTLKRWQRGSGRTLSKANADTAAWLTNQGFNTNQISKYDQAKVFRELRARGPNFTGADTLRIGDVLLKRNQT